MVQVVILVGVLIMSVVVHEVAHAWQARREGDNTAHDLGRITLNPLPHLDLVGSIIIPGLLASQGAPIFGWAKPVPVNPMNYRKYVAGDIRVSLAGIVSNLGLALLATLVSGAVVGVASATGGIGAVSTFALDTLQYAITINLILAFFNLIPIPPLDGSHVVAHLLPRPIADGYREMGRYGLLIVIAMIFLAPGVMEFFLTPVFELRGLADRFIRLWI
jgi:Zn-dependent protease